MEINEKTEHQILTDVKLGAPDETIFNRYKIDGDDLRRVLVKNIVDEDQKKNEKKKQKAASTLSRVNEIFQFASRKISDLMGSAWAFITAVVLLVIWASTGPIFQYSDTWQLIVNTATTIVTFLMVFLIQNTQNRNDKATQLKLDELLSAVHGARTGLVNLETRTDEELEDLQEEFKNIVTEKVEQAHKNSFKTSSEKEA